MKTIVLILSLTVIISGCAQSGYKKFYNPFVDTKALSGVELLGPNEEPRVLTSNDLDQDLRTLRAKRYIVVGYSSFNGKYEDTKNAAAQAKKLGATLVLVNSEYTNTQSSNSALLIPSNQTSFHTGSVYSGGTYGTYSGTTSSYGTSVVPFTMHQRRYDQTAYYLVKSTRKLRFGIALVDLTPNLRVEIERNTGALIDIVIEDTPAFYSNILAGDILISIDDNLVKNVKHAHELMVKIPEQQSVSTFVVMRNGRTKSIKINL